MRDARRWGLWGLLAFEALLGAYTFSIGSTPFVVMSLLAGGLLVVALGRKDDAYVPAWVFAGLALVTIARAAYQTIGQDVPPTQYVSYLVPLAFALAGVASWRASARTLAVGMGLMGLARGWFSIQFFQADVMPLVAANVVGAAGALAWAYAAWGAEPAEAPTEPAGA